MTKLTDEYRRNGRRGAKLYLSSHNSRLPFYVKYPEKWSEDWKPAPAWHAMGAELRAALRAGKGVVAAGIVIVMRPMLRRPFKNKVLCRIAGLLSSGTNTDTAVLIRRFQDITATREALKGQISWEAEGWWTAHCLAHPQHLLRASEEDLTQVAYYESFEKLYVGRSLRTRPGRYLAKYLGAVLTAAEIKVWADRQQAFAESRIGRVQFIEHDDPEGWVSVYKDGPASCMQGEECVSVYAHKKSVLRLAHWVQNNEIGARCIVRDDKKEWLRVYPPPEDGGFGRNLHDRLEKLGYKRGTLDGVLLAALSTEDGDGNDAYVCPYIDCGTGRGLSADRVMEDGEQYLRLSTDGDVGATETNGMITFESESRCTCDQCGNRIDEDDARTTDDSTYCENCYDELFVYAYNSSRRKQDQDDVRRDEAVQFGGEWYADDSEVLNYHGIFRCDDCGELTSENDMCSTADGCYCDNCVVSLDEEYDGYSYAASEDTRTLEDGRTVHKDWEDPDTDSKFHPTTVKVPCDRTLPLPLAEAGPVHVPGAQVPIPALLTFEQCEVGMRLLSLRNTETVYCITAMNVEDGTIDIEVEGAGNYYRHYALGVFVRAEVPPALALDAQASAAALAADALEAWIAEPEAA